MLGTRLAPNPERSRGQSRGKSGVQLRVPPRERRRHGWSRSRVGTQSRSALERQPDRGWDPSGSGPEPGTSEFNRGAGNRNWSLRLRQDGRQRQTRDRNRVGRRNRRRISDQHRCWHQRKPGAPNSWHYEPVWAGPARRAWSALGTRGLGSQTRAPQRRLPCAPGGLPAATLLAWRLQPT